MLPSQAHNPNCRLLILACSPPFLQVVVVVVVVVVVDVVVVVVVVVVAVVMLSLVRHCHYLARCCHLFQLYNLSV